MIILALSMFFMGCDDRVKVEEERNIIVTMLRIDRIEIVDNLWVTPAPIWGHLEAEDVPVERLVVHWWSNMYWDENDSSGYISSSLGVTGTYVSTKQSFTTFNTF